MKLTKEECEKELKNTTYLNVSIVNGDGMEVWSEEFKKTTTYSVFKQLIEEHFELKEKYQKILDDCHGYRHETHKIKMTARNLCDHFGVNNVEDLQNIYLNKPYELKDLKPGMWVWDNKAKEYFKIVGTHEDGTISVIVHDRDIPYQKVAMLGYYEPNRFFARKIKED